MGFLNNQDDRSCCSDDSITNDLFRNVSKHASVFCIWKIEGLGTVAVPKNKIGTFFTDAAYIIYTVTPKGGALPYPEMPTKDIKGGVFRSIHFWIGKNCDTAISGCAALRSAELDAQVSATILNRESEGRESARFLSYFRDKIMFIKKGQTTGNQKCETPSSTLYKVTGISLPVLKEFQDISWQNFSSSDVMILEIISKGVIFIWIGSSSTPLHKRYAKNFTDLKKEKNNNIRIIIIDDGYEETIIASDKKLFDDYLDPLSRILKFSKTESKIVLKPTPIKLYKCSEQSGKYKVAELKSGPILRSDLTNTSVFLIDRGEFGVFAWVGKEVNVKEKIEAIRNARGFIKKKGYSCGTPVARVLEGEEPFEIKSLIKGFENKFSKKGGALILPDNFDSDYISERQKIAADCQLVDDGKGDKFLWIVGEKETIQVSNDFGIYYASNCYVLKYGYGAGRKSRVLIYCWKGAHSSSGDREAALDFGIKLAEELNGDLVISSQGREPAHLLQIYEGKLKILCGKHRENAPSKYLVRVFGSTPYTSKAIEKPLRSSSLDSSGVFVLFSSSPYVWCGAKSTGDSREASRRMASINTPLISEGNEEQEFWEQLGGRGEYATEIQEPEENFENRFYHCEVEENIFTGTEILGFNQKSLIPEASWLLDTGKTIFLWRGNNCGIKNLRELIKAGETFLYNHPAGRDRNTMITAIRQGLEPATFTGIFDTWEKNFLRDYQSFDEFRSLLKAQESTSIVDLKTETTSSNFDNYAKYPLNILTTNNSDNLPEDVNVERKELHLTYDDFLKVFKIKPSEFDALPSWRRQRLKQTAGLF